MTKRIFTAAITGGLHTPTMSPYLPQTPKQIADDAVRAYEAGAAVAHIHVRDPETGRPSSDLDLYREVLEDITSRCDLVISVTTGGAPGMSLEQRVAAIPTFKPALASLNYGSLNFTLAGVLNHFQEWKHPWEPDFLGGTEDNIFANSFKTLRQFGAIFRDNNTKPELEVYDVGMINNAAHMISQGHLDAPVYIQFVMGALGGIPATVEHLVHLVQTAKNALGEFQWSVCAAGRHQIAMCNAGLLLGSHARVGLEDNLYLEKGVLAKSSAQQVEKIVRIARELGIEPATPTEARGILGLKSRDQEAF